jgi:hypothetical protein
MDYIVAGADAPIWRISIGPAELILEPNMQSRHHMQPDSPSCFKRLVTVDFKFPTTTTQASGQKT